MNALDVALLVVVASAVVGGYRLGFVARAISWVGLVAGVYVGARLLPTVISGMRDQPPPTRFMIAVGVVVLGAFVGQALGMLVGSRLHRSLPVGPLRTIDRGAGAVAGLAGVLTMVWLMAPAMADVPGWPARQARSSTVVRTVNGIFPRPPNALDALGRLTGPDGFPRVFDALQPAPNPGPPPAASGLSPAVAQRVAASTVKVEGQACNRIQDGSGFAAGPDTIVTNAHVVAGERQTSVIRLDGRRLSATVTLFDAERDLAVLRVPGLGQEPLPVGVGRVGATGAVFGHPNGQEALSITPAAIRQEVQAVGRDLYNSRETRRQVYILAAALAPGDSGGALVDDAGAVVGVAFAIAPDRPGTAYALTALELRAVIDQPRPGRADTGSCLVNA